MCQTDDGSFNQASEVKFYFVNEDESLELISGKKNAFLAILRFHFSLFEYLSRLQMKKSYLPTAREK